MNPAGSRLPNPGSETALVTGGGRRIGRAISSRLAEHGYRVAIHCNGSPAESSALAREINERGGRASSISADLATDDVDDLMERAADALGPVTLLVNNASEFVEDSPDSMSRERWDRQFRVNLSAPAFLMGAMAGQLPPDRTGCVVNIIDQRVWRLNPRFTSYTLSKAALWTATRTFAQALAPRIRVNAVGPGPTMASSRQSPEDFRRQQRACLLEKGPEAGDIAEAVIFLAGARNVTGQMIAVDGGQHLAWRTPDVEGIAE